MKEKKRGGEERKGGRGRKGLLSAIRMRWLHPRHCLYCLGSSAYPWIPLHCQEQLQAQNFEHTAPPPTHMGSFIAPIGVSPRQDKTQRLISPATGKYLLKQHCGDFLPYFTGIHKGANLIFMCTYFVLSSVLVQHFISIRTLKSQTLHVLPTETGISENNLITCLEFSQSKGRTGFRPEFLWVPVLSSALTPRFIPCLKIAFWEKTPGTTPISQREIIEGLESVSHWGGGIASPHTG